MVNVLKHAEQTRFAFVSVSKQAFARCFVQKHDIFNNLKIIFDGVKYPHLPYGGNLLVYLMSPDLK